MFARYKINLSTLSASTTATTINIPLSMDFQLVDQTDIVKRVFVDVETENAINPIIDYEKVRFLPLDPTGKHIDQISYNVNMISGTTYGEIGFNDDDLKFKKESFKQTFLNLNFYDTDNPFTQILVTYVTLYAELTPNGEFVFNSAKQDQPKSANETLVRFVLENPILNPRGFAEGYHLYDYKDELKIGESKYLYMRASFKNAKTGRSTNMMVKDYALPIDNLVHELYTRYKLMRNATGYYYEIDDTYQGSTGTTQNVTYNVNGQNNVSVNLYQIKAL